jgi:hypothetical protein
MSTATAYFITAGHRCDAEAAPQFTGEMLGSQDRSCGFEKVRQ